MVCLLGKGACMADDVSKQAKALSKRGASKGGQARAERLSPAERKEISRRAAEARWGNLVPAAPFNGELRIADRALDCAVLEDGRRVINQTAMQTAMDKRGGARRGPGV